MDVGLDRLLEARDLVRLLRQSRVGLLAHAASVDRDLRHLSEVLAAAGITPAVLFAPEHGFSGAAQDMAKVTDGRDERTGTVIVSLYGDKREDLVPKPEQLGLIDVLLIDLVDVGARYYTFVWTALLALRAAAKAGVHVVVLDRPNPISGDPARVEGRTQREGFLSFVGLEPVPIRHSLTIAELLVLHAARDRLPLGPSGALSVVPLRGWERRSLWRDLGRPFVQPSPNMPTADTALVYPGGCLIEGTNLSEGRGTTRPFELVGAPFVDGHRLARRLHALGLEGFIARPLSFIPCFHKHAGETCGGVQIHVTDPAVFRPVATYTALIALARAQSPTKFAFRTERYELVDDIPAFDLLTGSPHARLGIAVGEDCREIAEAVSAPDPTWPERMAQATVLLRRARWEG